MGIVRTDDRYYSEIAEAIRSKNGSSDEYYPSEMAAAIEALEGEPGEGAIELYDITVTPTGKTFIEYPDEGMGFGEVTVEGDANLAPQNIAAGVVIYGVEGTMVAGASIKVPDEYQSYVDHALTLYTEEYKHLAIFESDTHVAIVFLMNDFMVVSYDPTTTEFTARGWLSCSFVKETNTWNVTDWRTAISSGGSLVSNIRFSTMTWTFNGDVIWPVAGGGDPGSAGGNLNFSSSAGGSIGTERVAIAESLVFNASFSSSAVGTLTTLEG